MQDSSAVSLDVSALQNALAKIHEQVAAGHGRVEVTRDGSDDVCVFLSKAELQSLERALAIFSQTAEYKSMCDSLHRLAIEIGATGAAAELFSGEI